MLMYCQLHQTVQGNEPQREMPGVIFNHIEDMSDNVGAAKIILLFVEAYDGEGKATSHRPHHGVGFATELKHHSFAPSLSVTLVAATARCGRSAERTVC